jgi:hypothetical protein
MSDEAQTEAELALKKRRANAEQVSESYGLDEGDKELLEQNKQERDHILGEINELRDRSEKRKKEREEEEKRLATERAVEDARRKAEEEERKRKKEEDELKRHSERSLKQAEFEKWKNPPKANFVISKKLAATEGGVEGEGDQGDEKGRKSKEQLEAEKQAILAQRIKPLEIDGFDQGRLSEKAKELHHLIHRLEGEKYDLEKRYKSMQVQLMELADRARQANKVGKEGLKRIQGGDDSVDIIQTRFAGAPSKVEMYSKYERQKDKRSYVDRKVLYTGPQFGMPAERIKPSKIVRWNEEGLPVYEDGSTGAPVAAE